LGDTLNILLIINKDFLHEAENKFNPRNTMYISKNDGYLNPGYMHQKDVLINAQSLIELGRENYTKDDLELIQKAIQSRYEE
jgi:hypothetical protein